MALNAQYAATPQIGTVNLAATADSVLTGTPTTVSAAIITGATNGTRITKIVIKNTTVGAAAAGIVRLWLFDGTNYRLLYEVLMPATTSSATVSSYGIVLNEISNLDLLPLVLKTGHSIKASISVAQTASISIFGADI